MTKRIFQSILLVAGIVLVSSLIFIMGCLYDYFGKISSTQMKDQLDLAVNAVEVEGIDYLQRLSSSSSSKSSSSTTSYRLTWVASDGSVLFDTQADASTMENHLDRSEIQSALNSASGEGVSTRYSRTLMTKTIYRAQRLSDGSVLRISINQDSAGVLALGMLQPFLLILLIALVMSGVLARYISRYIAKPLNNLDLEHPLENQTYEEIAPLLRRINSQHLEISAVLHKLERQRNEFSQITDNMKECLVLLDSKDNILSINSAAMSFFDTDSSCVDRDFLLVDRSVDINNAINTAKKNGRANIRVNRKGRVFQFELSSITSSGEPVGTVMLFFDITDQAASEQMRREFTANVSHELKTPLQGIAGSAELLASDMVKPADRERFIGHIQTEAKHMVALIDDIIRLSQLDENRPDSSSSAVSVASEEVCLLDVASEVAKALEPVAASKSVNISVNGDETSCVQASRSLVYEVIFNLCDNAIKYNKDEGSVFVDISTKDSYYTVSVKDTGIGIPPEHQDRIFERFYRVDKSHSRASGGTGLGLSIVKHAVQSLGGHIELKSDPDIGTNITVFLPMTK